MRGPRVTTPPRIEKVGGHGTENENFGNGTSGSVTPLEDVGSGTNDIGGITAPNVGSGTENVGASEGVALDCDCHVLLVTAHGVCLYLHALLRDLVVISSSI